ncbi:DUF1365 domain-containing protein [Litoreibacter roseus]|uniref:DUF1365 domain-containing protein n=1 Tax=Litoreibacter roseus TaxID=2601869 RepID=A0A6N6JMA4_9RHOB|nr:DUF1365 domain-containing protein [Litoreibacter roseus]GFE66322.1 DUF1365 domain-containing protein [Litoreibacter roseus]
MRSIYHIEGRTYHGRKGEIENAFTYGVDYVLLDPDADVKGPVLFSRNGRNLTSLHDSDHGGTPRSGRGTSWVRDVLSAHGLDEMVVKIDLLAQPRMLGHVFNPVSFWLCYDVETNLRAVIPEVTNTFGDRHSYLCAHDDLRVITAEETLTARKIFHVSPFQAVEGDYTFRFDISESRIGIWIDYKSGPDGVLATLTGKRKPLTNRSILRACLRRPLGSRRVLGLIHWQALKLWWKGAKYNARPTPPAEDISR